MTAQMWLLIPQAALTTFSITNDVAKYFAIIPVMFMVALPGLSGLNVMELATAQKCGVVSVDL
jgi:K+-transporting ATPase ATPase B chain